MAKEPESPPKETSQAGGKKMIQTGDRWVELRDSGVSPVYVDSVVETGQLNGAVYISMGSIINDTSNQMMIDVACRLRMTVSTASLLHSILDKILSDVLKTQAAQQPPKKMN